MSEKFQSHGKSFTVSAVLNGILNDLKKISQSKIDIEIEKEYTELKNQLLTKNPNWRMFSNSEETFLKTVNISIERVKALKYGEIIMNEFQRTIGERVRADRAKTKGINTISDITTKIIEENLNIIRAMRKHTVGLNYNKSRKGR